MESKSKNPKAKCYNCKFSSQQFKVGKKTHLHCMLPEYEEGLENGTLSAWDTLQEWWDICEKHEFKTNIKIN